MATYTRYGHLGEHLLSGTIDFLNGTIKVVLLSSSYGVDLDGHQFYSDLIGELPTGNGYTAGGQALDGKSFSYDSGVDQTAALADNSVWTPSEPDTPLTARYAAVYADTGVGTTSPLIALVDFEADASALNASLTVDWSDTGGVLAV
ncbi:MAG: hypothetical protein ACRDQA_15760 [Nocardioidaceae bacterium]